jgi:uncharacterized membrane protein
MVYLLLWIAWSVIVSSILKIVWRYTLSVWNIITGWYACWWLLGILYLWYTNTIIYSLQQTDYIRRMVTILLSCVYVISLVLMYQITLERWLWVMQVSYRLWFLLVIVYGILFLQEQINVFSIIAFLLWSIAVLCMSMGVKMNFDYTALMWKPVALFISSWVGMVTFSFMMKSFLITNNLFLSTTIFLLASFWLCFFRTPYSPQSTWRNIQVIILWVILWFANFWATYFYTQALKYFDASAMYTISNISSMILVIVLWVIVFHEKYTKRQYIGMFLWCISFLLLRFSQ